MNARALLLPSASPGCRRRARGFGLIEMMIAITIGLFILLGLTSIFINMKRTYAAQDQLAQLQDNERLALTVLTTTIESAGYFPDPTAETKEQALPAASGSYGSFGAGQGLVGIGAGNDSIAARYLTASGDGLMDCLGQTNTSGAPKLMTNAFRLDANSAPGAKNNVLECSTDGGQTYTALVDNLVSMDIVYGTDTTGNGSALQYLQATAIQSSNYWPNVRTARITLEFANPFANQAGQPATISWTQTINVMGQTS